MTPRYGKGNGASQPQRHAIKRRQEGVTVMLTASCACSSENGAFAALKRAGQRNAALAGLCVMMFHRF